MAIMREPNIVKFFLVLFAFDIAFWGFTAWLPTYLVKTRGFSMMEMGVVASLPFFSGTIGSIAGGWVSDRYFGHDRRVPILMAEITSALLLYMTFTAHSIAMLIIAQTLAGFFLMSFFSAFWAMPMNSVPRHLMGVASGFINMAGQISAFLAPLALGYLVQVMGGDFATTFLLLIAALALSSAVVFTISPRPHSDRKEIAAG
jgi:sugar phosphate permease